MDQGYQYTYQDTTAQHHVSTSLDQGIPSSRGDDLQGIMAPPPAPMSYLDQYSSASDFSISNLYRNPFPMNMRSGDPVPDLRLIPVEQNSWYHDSGHRRSTSFENSLFNPNPQSEAWTALRVVGVPDASQAHAQTKRRRTDGPDNGTVHFSDVALSDAGSQGGANETPPSDSGYGTKSVATPSVIGSLPMDDRLGVPSNGTPSFERNIGRKSRSRERSSQADSDVIPVSGERFRFSCPVEGCNWKGKNSSDSRKHETRHQKLHKCDQPGCKRQYEGFGTSNDLDRHKLSVHNIDKNGESVRYKCFAENCNRRNKIWPRLDNFRKHLERMHGEELMNDLLKKSEMWHESTKQAQRDIRNLSLLVAQPRPLQKQAMYNSSGPWARDNIQQQSHGASVMPTALARDDDALSRSTEGIPHVDPAIHTPTNAISPATENYFPPSDHHSGYPSPAGEFGHYRSRSLSAFSTRAHSPQPQPTEKAIPDLPGDSWDNGVPKITRQLIKDLEKQISIWDSRRKHVYKGGPIPSGDNRSMLVDRGKDRAATLMAETGIKSEDMAKELREILLGVLKQPGVEEHNRGGLDPDNPNDPADDVQNEHRTFYKCDMCPKEVLRRCELKKHMKRHNKPYGCTFPNCGKTFGSKNDWKRHENSQHFLLQSWRCDITKESYPFTECGRLFYRRETFIHHLDRCHGVTEEKEIKNFLRSDEIGRNGQSRFWCGFCRKIHALKHRGMDAFNERFNHIDEEHFKKGQNVTSWQHPDGQGYSETAAVRQHCDDDETDVPDGDESVEGDDDHSGDTETTNDGKGDQLTTQQPRQLPIINFNAEPTINRGRATEPRGRPPPGPNKTLLYPSACRQPSRSPKRKFATSSTTTTTTTQSRTSDQGDTLSPNAHDPLSDIHPADAASIVQGNVMTRPPPSSQFMARASVAAALFSTTYPKYPIEQAKKSDLFFCCQCPSQPPTVIVKSLGGTCVCCSHRLCGYCMPERSPAEEE